MSRVFFFSFRKGMLSWRKVDFIAECHEIYSHKMAYRVATKLLHTVHIFTIKNRSPIKFWSKFGVKILLFLILKFLNNVFFGKKKNNSEHFHRFFDQIWKCWLIMRRVSDGRLQNYFTVFQEFFFFPAAT